MAATVVLTFLTTALPTSAQDEGPAPGWEQTGLATSAFDLMTPTSGAFFALTTDGLERSDDGGATWRLVNLPVTVDKQTELQVAVTPTDHTVLFVAGPEGVYRTRDDAQTWSLVYPTPNNRVLKIAISPVDPNLVYLALTGRAEPSSMWKFLRSRDGATTFETVEEALPSTCALRVDLLIPDPLDAATLYRAAPCISSRTDSSPLIVSHDQGHTIQATFNESLEYAERLVGGSGANPRRFYLATMRDSRAGGSTLFRSDDSAQTWTSVLEYRQPDTDTGIGDVAYNPSAPDHVWVALNGGGDGVLTSSDGGDTWQEDGAHGAGAGRRLILGIDARSLYLATDQGVWRQGLDNSNNE
jgi:photosystem II stability/assembly factor-like uncharacterized protein